MTYILISIIVILLITNIYTAYISITKQEKLEAIITSYDNFLTELAAFIDKSNKSLEAIDEKGSFKSDDEVGFFFDNLKKTYSKLDTFKKIYAEKR